MPQKYSVLKCATFLFCLLTIDAIYRADYILLIACAAFSTVISLLCFCCKSLTWTIDTKKLNRNLQRRC